MKSVIRFFGQPDSRPRWTKLILVGVVLMISLQLQARKVNEKIIYPNDTIEVVLEIRFPILAKEPAYENMQSNVYYYGPNGKFVVVKPKDALEVQFTLDGKLVRLISKNVKEAGLTRSSKPKFLRLHTDGKMRMYYWYWSTRTAAAPGTPGSMSMSFTGFVLQREGGNLKAFSGFYTQESLVEYFNDCPDVVAKIQSTAWRKRDSEELVAIYNEKCGN